MVRGRRKVTRHEASRREPGRSKRPKRGFIQFKSEKSRHSRYGWVPDSYDPRDFPYTPPAAVIAALPGSVDLSEKVGPVFSQGQLNSCTANSIAAAIRFQQMRQRAAGQDIDTFMPSRLFIYYNTRLIVHMVLADVGAPLRDAIKSVARQGACREESAKDSKHEVWPYDLTRFELEPPKHCYKFAQKHRTLYYHRLAQDLTHMKACLAEGHPFALGMWVFAAMETPGFAGHVPMPGPTEPSVASHAVLAVGYDDNVDGGSFLVRNSWGPKWGLQQPSAHRGHFTLPYAYMSNPNLVQDIWTIRFEEPAKAGNARTATASA
jgi:C1A family cysteine protease